MDSRGIDSASRVFSSATEMWAEELGSTATATATTTASPAAEAEAAPAAAASNGGAGEEAGGDGKRKEWYSKAIAYWQAVEASTEGVLGGYGCVNDADVKGSDAFLRPLLAERFGTAKWRFDSGSGIGRVTKNLLLRHFNEKRHGKILLDVWTKEKIHTGLPTFIVCLFRTSLLRKEDMM